MRAMQLLLGFFIALAACADTVNGDDDAWNIGDPADTDSEESVSGGCFYIGGIDRATIWGQPDDSPRCVSLSLSSDNSPHYPSTPDLSLDASWKLTGFSTYDADCHQREDAAYIDGADISGVITSPDDDYTTFIVDVQMTFEDGSTAHWVDDEVETESGMCN